MPATTTMKQSLATAVLAALPLATRAQGTTPPKVAAACNDVAIFMARGNDAPYHDGRTSPFIDATCGKFQAQGNSCDYMDIVFDATLGVEFCPTIQEGAVNGIRQITEYNAQCPDTLIVINGYSQGAMVSGALLSGGGEDACNVDSQTLGLDPASQAGQAVKAALLWGDVKHTANQPYNVLDGADKQAWPRTGANLERLNRYSAVLRSYCAAGDPVCANGDVIAQHLNYFELYTEEASSWVVSKLTPLLVKASSSAVPSSSVAPAPSSTAIPEDSTTVVTSTETSTMEVPVTVTKGAVKPSTMISSYVPVTIPHKHYNATAPYNNFTMPVSSTVMTADKPYETTYLPVEESHAPATTKAPEYSAVAAACPPATVYETVTDIVTKYV